MGSEPRLGTSSLDSIGAGVAVLTLIGEFHHRETRTLVRKLGWALDGTYEYVIIDMRGVKVFGALGLRTLVKASLRAHQAAVGFALVRPDPEIWRAFEITFLDEQLVHGATLEEAVALVTRGG
jgi:anti-anti-sigma factor